MIKQAKEMAKVRCTFELTKDEALTLCALRCEPKPSTAAAQVVRMAIRTASYRSPFAGEGGKR